MKKMKKSKMNDKFRILLSIFCLIVISCNSIDKNSSFDLFKENIYSLKVKSYYKNDTIVVNSQKSNKIYNLLKESFSFPLIRGEKEYTLRTIKTVLLYKNDSIYKLVINETEKNEISINYFLYNNKTNYNKYFGRNYINMNTYNKIDSILSNGSD